MTPITRLRYLIAKRGTEIVTVLLLGGVLLLAGAGWVYLNPTTAEVTDHTNAQTVTSEVTTSATVTNDTAVYDAGTVLHNQPVYLQRASPTPNVSVTTAFRDGASGTASHRLTLVYTATRGGETFWKRTTSVDTATTTGDSETTTTASLPMAETRTRLEAYRDEFGQAGRVDVEIRLSVDYAVGQYEGAFTETYPVRFGDGWYGLQSDSIEKSHSTPVTRTRTISPSNRLQFVLPLGLGVAFLFMGILGFASKRRVGTMRNELADEIHHGRYSEWFSEGELPAAEPASIVRMESLEALIDVAIDSRKRAIYDSSCGQYAVLDGTIQYRYAPHSHERQ